ncbi:HTH-type transcriptional regulator gltC [Serratia rubidaea]|uniref:HTH-type transcriptional regulator gltC n=1 Tax=Serratia rubidaea TaxID=61652 RepID=A0A447QUE9_SERRU|nr:HTH-type transcriptional regulator gltC [Serratia rubidaea]VTP62663.1 HTH-type transcriptional regulator gltC [Serratia rubidaea]
MRGDSFVSEVDERQLRYLYEVANYGGVRAAADKLGVNASAVSRQLAQLEHKLDMVLLERQGRGVTLTEIGLHLVDFYRERLQRQQELTMQLQEFRQLKRGHIAIGVGEGFIDRLLAARCAISASTIRISWWTCAAAPPPRLSPWCVKARWIWGCAPALTILIRGSRCARFAVRPFPPWSASAILWPDSAA